jgi:diguanylate cyclase (GGDEF)-like protein
MHRPGNGIGPVPSANRVAMGRAAAGLCVVGGLLGLLMAALPGEPARGADLQGSVAAVLALVAGCALFRWARALSPVVYDVLSVLFVVTTCAQLRLVAADEQIIPGELILAPIAVFAAAFRPPRSGAVVAVAMAVGLAWAYSVLPVPWGEQAVRFVVVMGFLCLLGALVFHLRRRVVALVGALEEAARTDALTGLANRRAFDEALTREFAVATRASRPMCVVMADVDHFKQYNDRFGHAAGDAVLVNVARTLALNTRPGDVVARLGGEEFALALPGIAVEQALAVVARIADALRAVSEDDGRVTCSFGVAEIGTDGPGGVLRRADAALYRAKTAGRDRCEVGNRSDGGVDTLG